MNLLSKLLRPKTSTDGNDTNQQTAKTVTSLGPGDLAPDFELPATSGGKLRLRDLRGRPIVLVFYPADNTPVCTSQLILYNEALSMFEAYDAEMLGISTDDAASHEAYARDLKLRIRLLADDDPFGSVTKAYGVYDAENRSSRRALFVIDREQRIFWSHVAEIDVNPGADGILNALAKMKN